MPGPRWACSLGGLSLTRPRLQEWDLPKQGGVQELVTGSSRSQHQPDSHAVSPQPLQEGPASSPPVCAPGSCQHFFAFIKAAAGRLPPQVDTRLLTLHGQKRGLRQALLLPFSAAPLSSWVCTQLPMCEPSLTPGLSGGVGWSQISQSICCSLSMVSLQ